MAPGTLCENMTSSTKPEVQCRQRRTETWHRQASRHKKLVKIGRIVFEICERTDEQTYLSQYLALSPPRGEVRVENKTTVTDGRSDSARCAPICVALDWSNDKTGRCFHMDG